MTKLTDEQRAFLIFFGSPDDGSRARFVEDGVRLTQELIDLGLIYHRGKDTNGMDNYDLTDEGEQLYGNLVGVDVN